MLQLFFVGGVVVVVFDWLSPPPPGFGVLALSKFRNSRKIKSEITILINKKNKVCTFHREQRKPHTDRFPTGLH